MRERGGAFGRPLRRVDVAIDLGEPVWRAVGCAACNGEGYRGRTGLYEIVPIDRKLETLNHDGASEADLTAAARRLSPSLLDDGVAKLRDGTTTVSEVARVVREDY